MGTVSGSTLTSRSVFWISCKRLHGDSLSCHTCGGIDSWNVDEGVVGRCHPLLRWDKRSCFHEGEGLLVGCHRCEILDLTSVGWLEDEVWMSLLNTCYSDPAEYGWWSLDIPNTCSQKFRSWRTDQVRGTSGWVFLQRICKSISLVNVLTSLRIKTGGVFLLHGELRLREEVWLFYHYTFVMVISYLWVIVNLTYVMSRVA